jgi:hypothetical protein
MAKMPSAQKEAFGRQTLSQFAQSGFSVRDFCNQQNLPLHSFYFWKCNISKRDNRRPEPFVLVLFAKSPYRSKHERQKPLRKRHFLSNRSETLCRERFVRGAESSVVYLVLLDELDRGVGLKNNCGRFEIHSPSCEWRHLLQISRQRRGNLFGRQSLGSRNDNFGPTAKRLLDEPHSIRTVAIQICQGSRQFARTRLAAKVTRCPKIGVGGSRSLLREHEFDELAICQRGLQLPATTDQQKELALKSVLLLRIGRLPRVS